MVTPTAAVVNGPKHGTVALDPTGSFTYTPNQNYSGQDSFTYKASDGTATSKAAKVLINVTAVNDAPAANPDTYTTAKNTKQIAKPTPGSPANDTDRDSKNLTAQLVSGPANGTVALKPNGAFTYTPNTDYQGTDTFTYHATDSAGKVGNIATVNLTIGPVTPDHVYFTGYDYNRGNAYIVTVVDTTTDTVIDTDNQPHQRPDSHRRRPWLHWHCFRHSHPPRVRPRIYIHPRHSDWQRDGDRHHHQHHRRHRTQYSRRTTHHPHGELCVRRSCRLHRPPRVHHRLELHRRRLLRQCDGDRHHHEHHRRHRPGMRWHPDHHARRR